VERKSFVIDLQFVNIRFNVRELKIRTHVLTFRVWFLLIWPRDMKEFTANQILFKSFSKLKFSTVYCSFSRLCKSESTNS